MKKRRWSITGHTASKLIVVLSGVFFFVALSHLDLCLAALHKVGAVLRPILIGLALAYLIDPLARWLERKKQPRRRAVLLACLAALALAAGALGVALPQLFKSVRSLLGSVPFYFSQIQLLLKWAQGHYGFDATPFLTFMGSYVELVDKALTFAADHLPQVVQYGRSLAGGLVQFFSGVILAVYILLDKATLLRQFRKVIWALCPAPLARRIFHVSATASQMLRGFVGGKLLDSMVVWFFCLLAASLAGIPYASLFSLVVGLTNIVPVLGPIVGGVFCCLLLLVLNPMKALIFAVLLLILQQVDGKIIGPLILGDATGLKTLWVLVAILVGGKVAGVPGMVLGVPFFATLYALGREALDARLARKGINYRGEPMEEAPAGEQEECTQLSFFDEAFAAAKTGRAPQKPEGECMEVTLRLKEDTLTDIWGRVDKAVPPEFWAPAPDKGAPPAGGQDTPPRESPPPGPEEGP